ncbi:MAG: hypothetical protein GXP44_02125 [bacterium]|nr:hypothetical protein [bacterium]
MKILTDYFSKLKKLMFSPTAFFGDIKDEEGYKEPTKFLFITLFLISILFLFFLVILPNDLKTNFILEFSRVISALGLGGLPFLILSLLAIAEIFVLGFIGVLVGALVIHIFTMAFGGAGKYADSYKVVAFVSILGILEPIGAALIVLGDYLDKAVNVTSGWFYLILAIPIIFLLIRLWFLTILIIGIKKIYTVKTKEAFLAISSFGALLFFMTAIVKPAYFPNMSNAVAVGLSILLILILPTARKMLKEAPRE